MIYNVFCFSTGYSNACLGSGTRVFGTRVHERLQTDPQESAEPRPLDHPETLAAAVGYPGRGGSHRLIRSAVRLEPRDDTVLQ